MSPDQSSEARSSGTYEAPKVCGKRLVGLKVRCERIAGHEGECSRYVEDDEQTDRPVGKVTVVLEKFDPAQPGRTDAWATHKTTLLIRESHLEAIQRKHGLSLIKWLETALEIELEALTDDTTWEIQR